MAYQPKQRRTRDFGEEAWLLPTLAGIYWVNPSERQEHLVLAAYM